MHRGLSATSIVRRDGCCQRYHTHGTHVPRGSSGHKDSIAAKWVLDAKPWDQSLYAGLGENRPMDLIDLLLGRPLATEEENAERIGPAKGIPIFGLDALSSAAYGPEAALTLLIPLGMAGVAYIVPISISIIFLLAIVYFSYRQTIMAYPQGGGSYTVARRK